MSTFAAVDDIYLARAIDRAVARVVYVAPGVGKELANALARAITRSELAVTIILDSDEDAYRIGYGDPEALVVLHEAARTQQFPVRQQKGLRLGLLVADEDLVIWAPTARAVEPERTQAQPNGIVLDGAAIRKLEAAVGAEGSNVLPGDADIGRAGLSPEELERMVAGLKSNPPAPFDLARRARVFSTKFQYVEVEIRGAEWADRRIRLSSLLLNADLPDDLQDLLETQVRPFQFAHDVELNVPYLVNGRHAYERNGERMFVPMTQAALAKEWAGVRDRYLRQVKGFGWLIRRDRLEAFRAEIDAYEETLRAWVIAFRAHVKKTEAKLIQSIVDSISSRLRRSARPDTYAGIDIAEEVRRGLERMRRAEPGVKVVIKDVSWESARDEEFMCALEAAFAPSELAGWFEEFVAAPERLDSLFDGDEA